MERLTRLIYTVACRKSKKYPNINAFMAGVYKEAVAYKDFSRVALGYATHISSRLSGGICRIGREIHPRYTIYIPAVTERRRARPKRARPGIYV